jgi:hypothetical protein
METAQLACPLCDGVFQVEVAWQGTQVACPHCDQAVTIPTLELAAAPQIVVEPESPTPITADAAPVEPLPPKVSRVDELKMARRLPDTAAGDSPFAVHESAPTIVTPEGTKVELRRRTPDERARLRNRWQLVVAVAGAVLLAALMFALLQVGR